MILRLGLIECQGQQLSGVLKVEDQRRLKDILSSASLDSLEKVYFTVNGLSALGTDSSDKKVREIPTECKFINHPFFICSCN